MDNQPPHEASINAFDHAGIRVSDRRRSVSFYQRLGFTETVVFDEYEANEMVSQSGVRINLIFNGVRCTHNVLLDNPIKLPGITHPAFVVDDIEALMRWLNAQGVTITEGPHAIGKRRIALFIRDPDMNVLEFNQLIDYSSEEQKHETVRS